MTDVGTSPARELQILERLVACAAQLAESFGEACIAEKTDRKAMLQLHDAFLRGFQAVRLGIRLQMALRAERPVSAKSPARQSAVQAGRLDIERPEAEGSEPPDHRLRSERDLEPERDRDRDRDYEPVSLPKFLATLGVAAGQAERLKAHLPAEVATQTLPTLQSLLARAKAAPPSAATAVRAPATAAGAPATAAALLLRPAPPTAKAALLRSASGPLGASPAARGPRVPLPGLGRPRPPPG